MNLSAMKIPMIVSSIIIAIATVLNWHFDERLTAARLERRDLSAKARESGVSAEAHHRTRRAARP